MKSTLHTELSIAETNLLMDVLDYAIQQMETSNFEINPFAMVHMAASAGFSDAAYLKTLFGRAIEYSMQYETNYPLTLIEESRRVIYAAINYAASQVETSNGEISIFCLDAATPLTPIDQLAFSSMLTEIMSFFDYPIDRFRFIIGDNRI